MTLLLSITDGVIKDADGRRVSTERARELWESKRVTRVNRYFRVLVGRNWNIKITKIVCTGWLKGEEIIEVNKEAL